MKRSSVVSLFAVISFLLIIPLITLLASEPQDIRERAAEPVTTIVPPTHSIKAITGYVYVDSNQNGDREPQEKALPDTTIKITQLNEKATNTNEVTQSVFDLKTDANGYFKYSLPTTQQQGTSYVVKLILPTGYKTINTNPVVLAGALTKEKQVIEFGLFPIEVTSPTGTSITPSRH